MDFAGSTDLVGSGILCYVTFQAVSPTFSGGGNCVRVAPGGGHSPRLLDPKSRRTQPK